MKSGADSGPTKIRFPRVFNDIIWCFLCYVVSHYLYRMIRIRKSVIAVILSKLYHPNNSASLWRLHKPLPVRD